MHVHDDSVMLVSELLIDTTLFHVVFPEMVFYQVILFKIEHIVVLGSMALHGTSHAFENHFENHSKQKIPQAEAWGKCLPRHESDVAS